MMRVAAMMTIMMIRVQLKTVVRRGRKDCKEATTIAMTTEEMIQRQQQQQLAVQMTLPPRQTSRYYSDVDQTLHQYQQ
jgi:aminopeptidase C